MSPPIDLKKRRRRRGASQVEYGFLLGIFVIPMVPAFVAGGLAMYKGFQAKRAEIVRSTP